MKQPLLFLIVLLAFSVCHVVAVETGTNGDFNTTDPGIAAWDYVGQAAQASGVYLGNGWVLTASHVTTTEAQFTLDGSTYMPVVGSGTTVSLPGYGTPDFTLFKIATSPNLPPLTIASTTTDDRSVVMIGYGGGYGETWGLNTIVDTEQYPIQVNDVNGNVRSSIDFFTPYSSTAGNVVPGDSGGGDFTYDPRTGQWELAGINEVILSDDQTGVPLYSGMIELSDYAAEIDAITGVPEPEQNTWLWLGVGVLLVCARARHTTRLQPS